MVKRCISKIRGIIIKRRIKKLCNKLTDCCGIVLCRLINIRAASLNPDIQWQKREAKKPETLTLKWRENHIHTKILNELEKELFEGKKTIGLGCGSGELETLFAKKGHSITGVDISKEALTIANKHKASEGLNNLHFVEASAVKLPFHDNSFDAGYAIELLEYIPSGQLKVLFGEVSRVLKPDGYFLIISSRKPPHAEPGQLRFFRKSNLAKLLDDMNLTISRIDLEQRKDKYRRHNMVRALLISRPAFQKTQRRRICVIGEYELHRYNQLGFHWDGQARAFGQLGYETLLLDVRAKEKKYLREKILDFQPDMLWLILKKYLPLVEWMKEDIRKIGCQVIYWFCDQKEPQQNNLKNLVDIMFLTNSGQIEDYKKAYNLDRIYYMPQASTPAFMHRLELEQKYDLGFTGGIMSPVHSERKKLIKQVGRKYGLIVRNDVRNNIANFYSQCKMVLGVNQNWASELYTSNRFFVALGCGAFYLCQWFPGIEKLAENHKHLVWFKTEKELFDLIDYYLQHDQERERIRENAQNLAHSKHTYTHRIQNMLDIIDGKTSQFYGFLE